MNSFFDLIEENNVEFVDFRFTDERGMLHHITLSVDQVNRDLISRGVSIDLSLSHNSDSGSYLIPDLSTAFLDPFVAQPTVVVLCDTTNHYNNVRSAAKNAEKYFSSKEGLSIKDILFDFELQFFIFDSMSFAINLEHTFYDLKSEESIIGAAKKDKNNNLGHRPDFKNGRYSIPPADSLHDIRSEMMTVLKAIGLDPISHYHETASSQSTISFGRNGLLKTADNIQKAKYVIKNVAQSYGKTATFMPRPLVWARGSSMPIRIYVMNKEADLLAGDNYGDTSDLCLNAVGGIIEHIRSICSFANSTTNSYRRSHHLFYKPFYSTHHNFAAIKIPRFNHFIEKSIEICFADPAANPYYLLASLAMAIVDGVKSQIDPGHPLELLDNSQDIIDNPLPESLIASIVNLINDNKFLFENDVFLPKQIELYSNTKIIEHNDINSAPHPAEFGIYFGS